MNYRFTLLLGLLLLCLPIANGTANAADLDSLKSVLAESKGEDRVKILSTLFKEYLNNDPILAYSYVREALSLSRELGYRSGEARALNDIGVIYRKRGNYDKALEYYVDAYKIYNQLKEEDGLSMIYNNIGTIHSIKGNNEKALENFLSSYKLLQRTGNKERTIGSLNNIGNVYRQMGNLDEALKYYERALELYQQQGEKSEAFEPITSIGNIHFEKGAWDEALQSYFEALEIERANKNLYGQAFALNHIGATYHQKGEYTTAIGFQRQAFKLAKSINSKPLLMEIYKSLSESYIANDDPLSAYTYLQFHNEIRDSLNSAQMQRRIQELNMAFEMEKKENELEILKRDEDINALRSENQKITILLILMGALLAVSVGIAFFRRMFKPAPKR